MSEQKLGQYTYISMTKVDIIEHKNLDIKITAVHEYIHSYLVRSTPYGNFLRGLENINSVDKRNKDYIDILDKNQDALHETVSTLIEIIYVWYKYGYAKSTKYFYSLPNDYKKLASKYKYIFDEKYVLNIYRQYLEFIDKTIEENKEDEKFCKRLRTYCNNILDEDEQKTSLNLLMYLILRTAELSLMIDVSSIEKVYWETPHILKKYTRNEEYKKYHPSYRFREYIKYVLPRKKQASKFNIGEVLCLPDVLGVELDNKNDEYILSMYKKDKLSDIEKIKNIIREPIYVKYPILNTINDLENEAILYAQPYPLNIKSIKKLFGTKIKSEYRNLNEEQFINLLRCVEFLHIHPRTGSKEEIEYLITINNTLNQKMKIKFNGDFMEINNLNLDYIIEIKEDLLKLLQGYEGDLFFTGCNRSKNILIEMKNRKIENNIFINSVSSLTTSIDFINHLFKGNNAEIVNTIYGDILIIRQDNIIFSQCMLPSCFDILDKNISNKRIKLNSVKEVNVESLSIVNNEEWHKIELSIEYFFKECASYIISKKEKNTLL